MTSVGYFIDLMHEYSTLNNGFKQISYILTILQGQDEYDVYVSYYLVI